uniref:uncharacterized protein LOC105352683 n=1 Tax=Fragaria vesca subsp. vesca TaxID=101020 RepID=UPI0005C822B4|nr:PREDICTED: uncharacterized protein LOC105352683 [Fragaria vesca subsp. vesca]
MEIEYRSGVDDAWYAVKILTEGDYGERLRVRFCEFGAEYDEVYEGENLTSVKHMEAFESRFRSASVQVQDSECPNVVEGMLVCAAVSNRPDDCRYFDAVVNKVKRKRHRIVEDEEECRCEFILFWRHGPNGGSLTTRFVGDICRVQPQTEEVHPLVTLFLQTVKSRIRNNELSHVPPSTLPTIPQHASSRGMTKFFSERDEHDQDRGGVSFIVVVKNLEKGISPFTIMEFIQEQLCISCHASVWPSKPSEPYVKGMIMVKGKNNLDKLSRFLDDPVQLIISPSGRPWVMTEMIQLDETLRISDRGCELMSHERTIICNKLKLVKFGSQEFKKAKRLKQLFKQREARLQ